MFIDTIYDPQLNCPNYDYDYIYHTKQLTIDTTSHDKYQIRYYEEFDKKTKKKESPRIRESLILKELVGCWYFI